MAFVNPLHWDIIHLYDSNSLRCLCLAGVTLALYSPASAQVYKWTDDKGEVHFGDSPYAMKESGGQGSVAIPAKKAATEPESALVMEEPTVQPTPDTQQEQPADNKPKPVEVVGDLDISASPNGLALVRANIKSNVKYPVDGIRLDVVLYHVAGRRAADLAIPFSGGKTRPDRLNAGETGVIEEEVGLQPEEVAGYNYRLVWAFLERVTSPGEGKPLPEDVYHKVIPGKPAQAQPGAEGSVAKQPAQKKETASTPKTAPAPAPAAPPATAP
jgi:hypothetical protein